MRGVRPLPAQTHDGRRLPSSVEVGWTRLLAFSRSRLGRQPFRLLDEPFGTVEKLGSVDLWQNELVVDLLARVR